ncbi:peptidoglycan-binding protein [Roseibium sp. CAU 1637]|uniref:Peptidoglycan-binding protein n=2 Tax=Roseibium limicola TaxID=2816037 RepID=A0A939ER50_9HYPH|nr:peptidoglycan-binding protein [Roseibium limicola]
MKQAADELGVPVEWGGDWRSFFDGPHFQLPWPAYPGTSNPAATAAAPVISERVEKAASSLLRAGDHGDEVRALQVSLSRLGHEADPDGDFGPQTYRAVRAFQKTAGLVPDGLVGPKTARKLKAALKSL